MGYKPIYQSLYQVVSLRGRVVGVAPSISNGVEKFGAYLQESAGPLG